MDVFKISANQLSNKIVNREITATEVVTIFIERINSVDKKINSFITTNFDNALSKAKSIDNKIKNKEKLGVLAGVPIGIKDNICVKGLKTTCASKMMTDFIPPYNATVVKKIEEHDGIIIGKMNMDEFGMGTTNEFSSFGAVHNPWNTDYVSGGSSGGSAAAVASMQIPVSLGSDTGGSIRCPSSFCSIIGFKPTYGTISRNGLVSYSNSLEQIGPMARYISDIVLLLNLISGYDKGDNTTLKFNPAYKLNDLEKITQKKYRIGIIKDLVDISDRNVSNLIYEKIQFLKDSNFPIESIKLNYSDYALPCYYIIATAEASSNLSRFDNVRYGYQSNPEGYEWNSYFSKSRSQFGEEVKRRILIGSYVLSAGYYGKYYLKAQKVRSALGAEIRKLFKKYDLILLPTMPSGPFKIGEKIKTPLDMYNLDIYTILANLSGIPAISLPAGFTNDGMPVGIQFLADAFNEQKLIDIGMLFEATNNENYEPEGL